MTENRSGTNKLIRGALFLVMGAALTVGTWSIYTLLTHKFGAPRQVAVFGAGMFDIAAIYFALLAQRYATTEDSGLAPRLAMFTMVTASSWTNWTHAQMEGWGTVGGILLGSAPVIAEVSFEMWHRFEHREALRRQGRVQQALPVIPGLAWLFFPTRAMRTTRDNVGARLDAVRHDAPHDEAHHDAQRIGNEAPSITASTRHDAQHIVITLQQPPQTRAITAAPRPPRQPVPHDAQTVVARQDRDAATRIIAAAQDASAGEAQDEMLVAPHGVDLTSLSKAAAVMAMREAHPDAQAPQIADALASHGIEVKANYVRTVLSRKQTSDPQQGTGGYL